ncbi:extracellular solute-binding protein [Paenibacillus lemnae]|uniref:Extracellular solute-binding protein n=1 Tax=Paenibacillus lemnae TaxID=1330551 RepID=A0A848M3T9_PAELE|nr:extracellular solute-binding protein [Paenibacillus lemnae]NMO95445.1 extracellular solute-binding protein [Paenibacillus lemnae]
MKPTSKGRFLFVFMLAAAMMLSACTGGGNEADGSKGSSSEKGNASGNKKVSISMFDRGQVSSDEGTYEENRWVKWIREQSGIDVKMVPVPRNEAQSTLNVMIASNQAPDLIWEFDRTYIGRLVSQGVVQPIDEYIEQYSTSYKKYLEENPELKAHLTFDDGKMYAVATKRPITAVANHGMWIRQDWLDEIGMEKPKTLDELIQVAQAFKEHYPDSTPIVGPTTADIYAGLNAAMSTQWYLEDGQMKYGATLDRFRDAIALEKQLFDLGLVDKEYFTDSNNQRANQLWTTDKAGIWMFQWGSGQVDLMMKDLLTNVPDAEPVPLESVETVNGKHGLYQEAIPHIYVAFNKDMKDPETAVKYLDWIVDQGWFTLMNGEEGVHYTKSGDTVKRMDTDKYNKEVLYANEYAVLKQMEVKPEDLIEQAADDELSQRLATLSAEALETALKNEFRRDIPYQPNFDEINEIRSTLDTFIRETRATTVTQGEKYTADWAIEEIRKEWTRLGGPEAEKIAQQWYEDNKANF